MPQEENVGKQEDPKEDSGVALNKILEECATAPGFICFAGYLTNKIDDSGNHIINFNYQRNKFSFDDAKMALDIFKEEIKKGWDKYMDEVPK